MPLFQGGTNSVKTLDNSPLIVEKMLHIWTAADVLAGQYDEVYANWDDVFLVRALLKMPSFDLLDNAESQGVAVYFVPSTGKLTISDGTPSLSLNDEVRILIIRTP